MFGKKNKQINSSNNEGTEKVKPLDILNKDSIPSFAKNNKDLNMHELDTHREIESVIRELAGYELDPEDNVWKKSFDPILNNFGIRKIKMHMEAIINKHAMTTDLTLEQINSIILYHNEELIRWFKLNKKKCDAQLSDFSTIIAEIDNRCFLVLSRSLKAGQRNAITARTKLTQSSSVDRNI